MANAINWFEIPATNLSRAKAFYGTILNAELAVQEIMDTQMAFLPAEDGAVGGAIVQGEGYIPSADGTIPYLNGGTDLSGILEKVADAGGEVVLPKTQISEEIGYFAFFMDTEGNKVALHSPS